VNQCFSWFLQLWCLSDEKRQFSLETLRLVNGSSYSRQFSEKCLGWWLIYAFSIGWKMPTCQSITLNKYFTKSSRTWAALITLTISLDGCQVISIPQFWDDISHFGEKWNYLNFFKTGNVFLILHGSGWSYFWAPGTCMAHF